MDSTSKFVKLLSANQCVSNELTVPHVFCLKYGASIPLTVKLVVRNGYEIWLDFDKKNERFVGLRFFFSQLALRGGQALVFDYCGGFNFKVYILGVDGNEIEYPMIVHHLQTSQPRNVSVYDDGWSFASYVKSGYVRYGPVRSGRNQIVVPKSFVDRFGSIVPNKLELVVSCGIRLVAYFNRSECKITGMASVCNMLRLFDLEKFNMFVFKYVMGNTFNVMGFDSSLIETAIYPVPPMYAEMYDGELVAFEISVQPYHMLPYCHGVDVSVEFKDVLDCWDKVDYITVYKENRCWTLQIRKRCNWKRTAIHDGWIDFRDEFELVVGDVLKFETKDDTMYNYNVRIVRAVPHVP